MPKKYYYNYIIDHIKKRSKTMEKHIKLNNFKINKINYKFNEGIKAGEKFRIQPKIECKMGKNGKNLFVNLSVRINEDISSPVPFDLDVAMFGVFTIVSEEEQKVFVSEAIETLYPFLRSAVAAITANCNIPAYILPVIDPESVGGDGTSAPLN